MVWFSKVPLDVVKLLVESWECSLLDVRIAYEASKRFNREELVKYFEKVIAEIQEEASRSITPQPSVTSYNIL